MEVNSLGLDEELEDEVDKILRLYLSNPIILDKTEFLKSESFNAGVEKAMGVAGIYTCLVSNGISMVDALELIYTILSAETSIKISDINKEATINAPPQQFGIV